MGYGTKMCTGCNWRNLTKYQECKGCNSDISGVQASRPEVLVFYDVERVSGKEESLPFSIVLVAMKSVSGEVVKKKERSRVTWLHVPIQMGRAVG